MILSCQNISKSFGGENVLNHVNFLINEQEKMALIGINGAGKTTLLKIITGEYEADDGMVVLKRGASLGYLSQVMDITSDRTIYEEMLDAVKETIQMEERIRFLEKEISSRKGEDLERVMEEYARLTDRFEKEEGYAVESRIKGVLKGLGFTEGEYQIPIAKLSGGQKTRVALSRLLLTRPDLILLDEPTNHLDMDAIHWLETFLASYRGAVLIVSHDRYFLDRVVTKVVEIEAGQSLLFSGNYSQYAQKKKALRDAQMKQYLNQQQEIARQQEVISKLKSFNRQKSIKRAESREKMLNKIEELERPQLAQKHIRFRLTPDQESGQEVLDIEGLSKSFGQKHLFRNLDLSIRKGEVVGLLGANGTGKTTLLKIINRLLRADSGRISYGSKVSIGYYDQEQDILDDENTIFDEISNAFPKLTHTRIRNVLAAFLFTGDRVFEQIGHLSGGEKGRVSLAKLMLSDANFLILDEPTNHLDIQSREILEDAVNDYEGTVFYVSHDRYFIDRTASRILELSPSGIVNYKGNYSYYLEQKEAGHVKADSDSVKDLLPAQAAALSGSSSKEEWLKAREEAARQRKLENDLKKAEDAISRLEEENRQIQDQMNLPEVASDPEKLLSLSGQYEKNEEELLLQYERWESLSE